MRERGERETHLISGIHRLSRGEEASDLIKVTIQGSGVDGPSGPSERGRGRAHDETRMLLLGTHSTDTHHAAGTSGLGERLGDRASEGRREEENRPYGGEERSLEVEREERHWRD
jgi:hypothetical protein